MGPLHKDEFGQPIYGDRDRPDLEAIRNVGLPFWLAGGYSSRQALHEALAVGATGIQAGSIFALAEDSGMRPEYRSAILNKLRSDADDTSLVRTTMFSPTGFSFKVVQLEGTLSEDQVYENRRRVCDLGVLQQIGLSKPDEAGLRTLFQRCPAGPIVSYLDKRGLARNTEERRCVCNGLLSCVGHGQVKEMRGELVEEPCRL